MWEIDIDPNLSCSEFEENAEDSESALSELLTTRTDSDGLPQCPFCGSGPYYPSSIKKNKSVTACANNSCPIFGIKMTVKQWRSRAS